MDRLRAEDSRALLSRSVHVVVNRPVKGSQQPINSVGLLCHACVDLHGLTKRFMLLLPGDEAKRPGAEYLVTCCQIEGFAHRIVRWHRMM